MAEFPRLKTAAVAQYPATRTESFRNQVLRFLDGSEQRYRNSKGALRRWEIRLELLDDSELAAMESFFAARQGRFESFAFTDPWDGTTYPDCSLANDEMETAVAAEMRGATALTVVENRR
jgi:uncharacterized protein (TIGR02217 family)